MFFARFISIFFIISILTACASSGTKIETSQVNKIKTGVTTKNEMMRMFGAPLSQSYNSEGKLTMIWFYNYVGAFGMGMENQSLAVLFDESEKVEKYNLVNGGVNGVRFGR